MAISQDRLSSRGLTGLTTTSFIAATDKTKDTPGNSTTIQGSAAVTALSNKKAQTIGKSSVFDVTDTLGSEGNSGNAGIISELTDIACGNVGGDDGKESLNNRSIEKNSSSGCGSSLDGTLLLKNQLAKHTKGLPDHMVKKLETAILTETKQYSGVTSKILGKIDNSSIIMQGIGMVKKSLSPMGGSLASKLEIKAMMSCPTPYNAGDSEVLGGGVIDGLLGSKQCLDIGKVIDIMSGMILSGVLKGTVVGAALSMFKSYDDVSSPSKKIKLLAEVINIGGSISGADLAISNGKSRFILDALGGSDLANIGGSPSTEFQDLMTAINGADPGWASNADGDDDYTSTVGNDYMATLSEKTLAGDTSGYTGTLGDGPSGSSSSSKNILLANLPRNKPKAVVTANGSDWSVMSMLEEMNF